MTLWRRELASGRERKRCSRLDATWWRWQRAVGVQRIEPPGLEPAAPAIRLHSRTLATGQECEPLQIFHPI